MLSASELLTAYARGHFPMATGAGTDQLYWFNPDPRGILPLGQLHASRSLRRDLQRGNWSAHHAEDFDSVVAHCAARDQTWINAPLKRLYRELYDRGNAHALEVHKDGKLAGGIFGVILGGAYFGESMFSTQTSGSRAALLWMDWLLRRAGFRLFDTQYLTPHLQSMGGCEISRQEYWHRLAPAIRLKPQILEAISLIDNHALVQEITQTS